MLRLTGMARRQFPRGYTQHWQCTHLVLCVAMPAKPRPLSGLRKVLTLLSPLTNFTCDGGQCAVRNHLLHQPRATIEAAMLAG